MARLNPALKSFWRTKADIKILKGGRASSKTWDAAGMLVFLASRYTIKVLCMRQFQVRISDSVYAVLVTQIRAFGMEAEFKILNNSIEHRRTGSSFHFYGIHRNIREIKGFEGADIGWIEEAEGLTVEQWSIIEPTLRKEGAEAWMLYNPHLVSDYIETFKHDPEAGVIVRHINYDENPFLSETMLRKIRRMKRDDPEEYEHIYRGVPRTDDDQVVIKRSWIEAAIDAHIHLGIEPCGDRRIGFDVADSGTDLCAQVYAEGIVNLWSENWKAREDELLKSCQRVYNEAVNRGARIEYDSIGVGASAGAKFGELNDARFEEDRAATMIEYRKFVAGAGVVDPDGFYINAPGEQVTNKEFFSNLKAQAWWCVADRFRNTYNAVRNGEKFAEHDLISISSDMPNLGELVKQLSTPRRHFDKLSKVKVESKDDLAKRDVPSPNDADAFIMANSPQEQDVLGDLLRMALK